MERFNMRNGRKRFLPQAGGICIWCCLLAFGSDTVLAQAKQASPSRALATATVKPSPLTTPDGRYLLQTGDEIAIKVLDLQELSETLTIAPDGRISALLVHNVQAAGLTVEALRETLTALYARYYRRPEVSVTLRSFANQKVYVGGEVARPGLISLVGQVSALSAIFQSGGFLTSAKPEEVIVVRNDGRNEPVAMKLNLQNVMKKGAPDLPLAPFDVVYVPMSKISQLNQFVDQYVRKMLPVTLTGGFTYLVGNPTSVVRFQ
jgi:protein involved in polysaccharide export with SLBB domain